MRPLRPVDEKYPMIHGWMENPQNYPKNGGHKGYDYACPVGVEDFACLDAEVISAQYRPESGYGREIVLRVNEHVTMVYGHHSEYLVKVGDRVKAGQVIGLTGGDPNDADPVDGYSSGPHLHFEPRIDNVPVDPAIFFAMDFPDSSGLSSNTEISGDEYVTVITDKLKVRPKPGTTEKEICEVKKGQKFKKSGAVLPGTGTVKGWQPVEVYLGIGAGDEDYIE